MVKADKSLTMQTQVLVVQATNPESETIAWAAAVIRRGGLVAFPTETVIRPGGGCPQRRGRGAHLHR